MKKKRGKFDEQKRRKTHWGWKSEIKMMNTKFRGIFLLKCLGYGNLSHLHFMAIKISSHQLKARFFPIPGSLVNLPSHPGTVSLDPFQVVQDLVWLTSSTIIMGT